MRGRHIWRLTGPGVASWVIAPGLASCTQLLDRAGAAAAVAVAAAPPANCFGSKSSSADGAAAVATSSSAAAGVAAAQPSVGAANTIGNLPSACAAAGPAAPFHTGPTTSSSSSSSKSSFRNTHIRFCSNIASARADGEAGPGSEFGRLAGGGLAAARVPSTGAGSRGCGGGSGRQGGGHWRWSGRWNAGAGSGSHSAFGFGAGAAAAAAGALTAPSVLADPSSGQSLPEAVAAAQAALKTAWVEVEEEFARVNARLPAHAPSLKGEPPTVSEVHGAVEVMVPIREGADANAVLRELRQGLGGQGSTSYSESVYGASRTVRMEIRQSGGTLRVMMFVPPRGGSEQAQVVISKRSSFSPEEMAALGRVVVAANVTFGLDQPPRSTSAQRHGLYGSMDSDANARAMESLFEEFARSALHGFMVGPMQQIFGELQRGMGLPPDEEDEVEQGDGGGVGPEGGFGPFGGFGGFGGPFGGSGGAYPGLPAPPPSVQHRPRVPGGGGGTSAQGYDWGNPAAARAVEQLLAMGAQVFPPGNKDKMDWGVLAGYEEQKRTIEDCLLLPLLRPDVYAKLARATRKTFANNRPRAVLFEGPPGTGKTTSARVISSQAAVPLIYLPLEAVLSKWYGQSEQQLGAVFKAAEAMGGAIIFLDELDALGGNRESGGLHEVSRRLLSVLLREMEGFDAETKRTVVIGATNRKTDLDPALLSRFDLVITFGLPDTACRQLILRQYAQQLSDSEVAQLAERTGGMSGRDLRDVCEHTERRWASKIIRGEVREEDLPQLAEYLASADERANAVQRVQQQATAAGALNRLLGATGVGGGRGLPSWLTGGGQQ